MLRIGKKRERDKYRLNSKRSAAKRWLVIFLKATCVMVVSASGLYIVLNYQALLRQTNNNPAKLAVAYKSKKEKYKAEPNRIEIPSIAVVGRLAYPPNTSTLYQLLENSVVHYPGTKNPWDEGNAVFIAHSSNGGHVIKWEYGLEFSTINKLNSGDKIIIYHEDKPINFTVTDKKIVNKTDKSVLENNFDGVTLITCWPLGTDLQRYVVIAKKV